MPPASCAATSVARRASSSEVLPWSTWPMMVTTGGRATSVLVGIGRVGEAGLDVAFGDALGPVAHFRHHQLGGVGIDRLVDGRHHAHAHQRLDHVGAALGHALGEFLDRDGLGDRDLAIDLLLRLVVVLAAAVALETAALLRHRPAAEIVLALDRTADVDLVGAALGHLAARARRLRQALVDGRPHRRPAQRAGRTGTRCAHRAADRRGVGSWTAHRCRFPGPAARPSVAAPPWQPGRDAFGPGRRPCA